MLAHAASLVRQSAAVTLPYFYAGVRGELPHETKADESPVTAADRAAEHFLRREIIRAYPDFGIIGEEFDSHNEAARFSWIIDPIDGTKSFIHGVPLYTTLLGLMDTKSGEPLLGCVYAPATGELACARKGGGVQFELQPTRFDVGPDVDSNVVGDFSRAAPPSTNTKKSPPKKMQKNPKKILPKKLPQKLPKKLSESLLLSYDWAAACRAHPRAQNLMQGARMCRTWADGYAYLMLSSSRAQAVVDARMHLWDIVPVYAVAREAGAVITDFEGKKLDMAHLYAQTQKDKNAGINMLTAADAKLSREILSVLRAS